MVAKMILIFWCIYLVSEVNALDRCDVTGCLEMKDKSRGGVDDYIYKIENPATEEERLFCQMKSGPFCFPVLQDTKECVTKVLVDKTNQGDRYCFHKEIKLDDVKYTAVNMMCKTRKHTGVSPYECPDLSYLPDWDYRSHNDNEKILGPTKWSQNYGECEGTNNQSPVDLVTSSMEVVDKTTVDPIRFFGYDVEGLQKGKWRLENNGHSPEVELLDRKVAKGMYMTGGPLKKPGDDRYNLLQFHFHWGNTSQEGSEHTVDGKGFPMEMHIVQRNEKLLPTDQERFTALGFLFEVSEKDNPMLLPITDLLYKVPKWKRKAEFKGEFPNLDGLVKDAINGDFYSYSGSFTTPPCSPVVRWIVFKNTLKISEAQLGKFKALFNQHGLKLLSNHRPVQPLNERKVQHYQ